MLVLDFSYFFHFIFMFFVLNLLLLIAALDHFIILLVFLDLLLLTSLLVCVVYTVLSGHTIGYNYALLIFGIAAADTAVGLGLFILFFKTTNNVSVND
jgi:NADH:ubiquinone oxidoreductase subunit K